ncbi:hypothetical protein [Opitutus terrae]|uniref:Uncharacterized protein n=1 Tax=Opitutus terrae (strain DSM 11246 / JCM 15787 / PB90-1) TaxID=452637 RepID=B1ZNZ5_OPITP|nr:hypothetical protein [Opitutus terrae]ACB77484.1 hypothetical protein Oter_4211 [Opitutus terrae PB90-1]
MHSSLRPFVGGVLLAALPALAHAHPGHDDPEITWDFSHLVAHPLATIGCLLVIAGGIWLAWHFARRSAKPPRPRTDSR